MPGPSSLNSKGRRGVFRSQWEQRREQRLLFRGDHKASDPKCPQPRHSLICGGEGEGQGSFQGTLWGRFSAFQAGPSEHHTELAAGLRGVP